eukprot:5150045-Heterocapsa_arctica.AAC.1
MMWSMFSVLVSMVIANLSLFVLLRSSLCFRSEPIHGPKSSLGLMSSIFESAMDPSLGWVRTFVPDQIWTEIAAVYM